MNIKSIVALVLLFFTRVALAVPVVEVVAVEANNDAIALKLVGRLQARNEIILSSYVDAHITELLLPGTRVRSGQMVAQLDTQFLQIQRDLAAIEVSRLQHDVDYLNRKLDRNKRLAEKKNISEDELDTLEQEAIQAQIHLKKAKLALVELELKLKLCTLTAKTDAIVTERYVKLGDYIDEGERIARLIPLNGYEIVTQVPADYRDVLKIGKQMRVTSARGNFTLTVDRVLDVVTDDTQSIQLFLAPEPGTAIPLTVGLQMALEASFTHSDTFLVSVDAVIPAENSAYVFKLTNGNVIEKRRIQILASSGDRFVVSGSIDAGDKVVVRGQRQIKDGHKVLLKRGGALTP